MPTATLPRRMDLTVENLEAAIREARDWWIKVAGFGSYARINQGDCEDFAQYVLTYFGKENETLYTQWDGELSEIDPETGYANMETWDYDLLRRNGWLGLLPDGWENYSPGDEHCYIVFQGKCYDSECPEGALTPMHLPYFQRRIAQYHEYGSRK